MEAGHLLLRWRGRGPNVGQPCTALGPPMAVSLLWHLGGPLLSLMHKVHSAPFSFPSSLQLEVHSVPHFRASKQSLLWGT